MNISYKDVEAECNELHNLAKNMKKISEDIASIRDKLNGCWKGIAADAYIDLLNNVTYSFDSVFVSIESSILYMASCAEGYQALDKSVMDEICGYLNIDSNSLLTPLTNNSPQQTPIDNGSTNLEQSIETIEDITEEYKVGNSVTILDGEFKGMSGTISNIDENNKTCNVSVQIDGEIKTVKMDFSKIL